MAKTDLVGGYEHNVIVPVADKGWPAVRVVDNFIS